MYVESMAQALALANNINIYVMHTIRTVKNKMVYTNTVRKIYNILNISIW